MKKIAMGLLTVMCALAFSATAIAAPEVETPKISIIDSFDAEDWSFGNYDWFSPIDDELGALEEFEGVTVIKWQGDLCVRRPVYVSEFDCEFVMDSAYAQSDADWQLAQVKLTAQTDDKTQYLDMADTAEQIFKDMRAAAEAAAPEGTLVKAFYDDDDVFERMRGVEQPGERIFWNSQDTNLTHGDSEYEGITSLSYNLSDGVYTLEYTFGITKARG